MPAVLLAGGVGVALVLRALSKRSNGSIRSNVQCAGCSLGMCKHAGHIRRCRLAALGGAGLDPLDPLDLLDCALSRMC